jgi:hypothetical protein
MNIIFVQIPSTNFENVHKFAMSCDLTWNLVKKIHTNENTHTMV